MKRKLGLTAALVVALAVAGYAQKADFSGTWTPDVPADAAAAPPAGGGGGGGGRGGGMGGPMTVKQTGDSLSVERQGRNGATTTAYKLDGSEFEVAGRGGAMMKATAKWDGSKLVITTKTDNGDQVQTWSLADGKLTIERAGQNGPVKTVYKKTT
jgi:hypothetical protein